VGDTSATPSDRSEGTAGDPLRHTALIDSHRRLGAKLVEFGGWEMPLSYPSGTIAEHRACRHDAVAFDVSHLGTVRVEGPDAFDRLQSALSNDLRKVAPGRPSTPTCSTTTARWWTTSSCGGWPTASST